MKKSIIATAVACLAVLALLVPASVAAPAGEAPDRDKHRPCEPHGRWELDLEDDGARIEVDYEVTAAAGERWKVKIRHGGVKVFDGSKVTRHDDDDRPDFEIERFVRDKAGTHHFWARARNTVTGAVCSGGLSI